MRPIAALIFFTRLPLWKWVNVPADHYRNLVTYWSLSGWVTASIAAFTLWGAAQWLPFSTAVILSMSTRILLTGGLHEDGLADFCDGFGGGRDRERILSIMKDSHIGTYGVLGLILYFLLYYSLLNSLSLPVAISIVLMADPASKFIASMIINRLPYARKPEESKVQLTYSPMSPRERLISLLFGVLPLLVLGGPKALLALVLPGLIFLLLIRYMREKIGGYTGDCCGALFLFCELAFLINYLIVLKWNLF